MDNGFGLSSGNWAPNAWTANQYKGSLNDFVQLNEMEQDHFYTESFKEEHPHKITNSFYKRGEDEDVEN